MNTRPPAAELAFVVVIIGAVIVYGAAAGALLDRFLPLTRIYP